ncbi:MAG: hypothetical protein M1455_06360 [Actinobacteria bacterium]|nr:hypothetical protein [Actinomycetota bacterium]
MSSLAEIISHKQPATFAVLAAMAGRQYASGWKQGRVAVFVPRKQQPKPVKGELAAAFS